MKKLIAIVITLIFTFNNTGYCLRVPLGAADRAQETIKHVVHPKAIPWGDVNAFVNAIDSWLNTAKGAGILDAFVFGSRANAREKKTSDIDIGIFVDKHITREDYRKLKSLWKSKLEVDLLIYSYDDLKDVIRQIHPEAPLDDGLLEEMKKAVGSMASDAVRIQIKRSADEALLREAIKRTGAHGVARISFKGYARQGSFIRTLRQGVKNRDMFYIDIENLLKPDGTPDFGMIFGNLVYLSMGVADTFGPHFYLDPEKMTFAVSELLKNAFTHGNKADTSLPILLYLDVDAGKVFVYDFNKPLDLEAKGLLKSAKAHLLFGEKFGVRELKTLWAYERTGLPGGKAGNELIGTEASIKKLRPSNASGRSL